MNEQADGRTMSWIHRDLRAHALIRRPSVVPVACFTELLPSGVTMVAVVGTAPEGDGEGLRVARTGLRVLNVHDVMAMVEVPAFGPTVSHDVLRARCRAAAVWRAAAVLCGPADVRTAVDQLVGSGVVVGTGPLRPEDLVVGGSREQRTHVQRALDDGAGQVAVVLGAAQPPLGVAWGAIEGLDVVVDLAARYDAVVKAVLPCAQMAPAVVAQASRDCADAGVRVVQSGVWFPHGRAPLRAISHMRDGVGGRALIKWTEPVASLDRLLLAHAEGVDLFNGDVEALAEQAQRREVLGGIRVPLRGVDYSWSAGGAV